MNPLCSDWGPVSFSMPRASKRGVGFMVAIRQHGTLESEMFSHISLLHKKPSRHSVLFATVPP